MTDVLDWLKARAPGFNRLSDQEVDAISDFSLLWGLFESSLLNTNGNARAIRRLVDSWNKARTLDAKLIDPQLAYFKQRYFTNGEFTHHFNDLRLRPNDNEALVRAVINGSDNDPSNGVVAVLIIIFRYRNNLFHGVKWLDNFSDQLGNFTAANAVLKQILEQHSPNITR